MADSFTIGVFAVIPDDEGRVLLCHRRDFDLWNLPGGGLNRGESPWDGAAREAMEELGVQIEIQGLVGVYSKPDVDEIVICFRCGPLREKPSLSSEVDDFRYFSVSEIPPNAVPKQVERIRDAFAGAAPMLKVQRGPSAIELLKQGRL